MVRFRSTRLLADILSFFIEAEKVTVLGKESHLLCFYHHPLLTYVLYAFVIFVFFSLLSNAYLMTMGRMLEWSISMLLPAPVILRVKFFAHYVFGCYPSTRFISLWFLPQLSKYELLGLNTSLSFFLYTSLILCSCDYCSWWCVLESWIRICEDLCALPCKSY